MTFLRPFFTFRYLHFSAARHDHFTSASPTPPSGYVSMGLQGYLLDAAVPGSVPMAWYWSTQNGSLNVFGDNVLAQDDGHNVPKPTGCAHDISTAAVRHFPAQFPPF